MSPCRYVLTKLLLFFVNVCELCYELLYFSSWSGLHNLGNCLIFQIHLNDQNVKLKSSEVAKSNVEKKKQMRSHLANVCDVYFKNKSRATFFVISNLFFCSYQRKKPFFFYRRFFCRKKSLFGLWEKRKIFLKKLEWKDG